MKITAETVRTDFNDPVAVVHYARAAHYLGLWRSERILIERYFLDKRAPLLEAGCGAGRATIGLWDEGFRKLHAFDFAEELLDQARHLAEQRGVSRIHFFHADATRLGETLKVGRGVPASRRKPNGPAAAPSASATARVATPFQGALFLFNGLMQIPGRENRRAALRELVAVCARGAPFIFTTHDREISPRERALWEEEAARWKTGQQDPRLVEFGDRYFQDESGRTFMHLPDRREILEDLAATGWKHTFDALRKEIATESRGVLDFSDECRFWVAHAV